MNTQENTHMKKIKKGEYGYRNSMRRGRVIKIAILTLFILAQLGARWFTDSGALKNILTVMAVITVIPTANLAAPYIAIFPFKTSSREFYEKLAPYESKFTILYDLVLTTKDDVLPMDAIVVHPTGIYAYCINQKAKLPRAEKALNEILAAQRLDPNMKITGELSSFEKRVKSLKAASEYEDEGSTAYAVKVMKGLSM